jgi:hypothetical protein
VPNARKVLLTGSMIRRLLLTDQGSDRRWMTVTPTRTSVWSRLERLLTHLFRQLFQKVCNDTRNEFVQEVNNDAWKKGDAGPRPMEILNINNLYKILKLSHHRGQAEAGACHG